MNNGELLTARETSVYLRVSDTTIRKLRRAGAIRPVHLSRRVLYVRRDLDQLIDNGGVTHVELADLLCPAFAEIPTRDATSTEDPSPTSTST